VRRRDSGGVRLRARLQRGERGHAGDGAQAPPQRQLRERADRRIGRQRRWRREEALHGPTVAVGVGGVRPSQRDLLQLAGRVETTLALLLFHFLNFLFPVLIFYFNPLEVKLG
jgi:hypothetical protein